MVQIPASKIAASVLPSLSKSAGAGIEVEEPIVYMAKEPSLLFLIWNSVVWECHRPKSALPSPSKSNDTLPTGGSNGAAALCEDNDKKPKRDSKEETIFSLNEGAFTVSNPSGSVGALKKSAAFAPGRAVMIETKLVTAEDESLKLKGSGAAEIGAGVLLMMGTGLVGALCESLNRKIGEIKAKSKIVAVDLTHVSEFLRLRIINYRRSLSHRSRDVVRLYLALRSNTG